METKDFIIEKAYYLFLNKSYDGISVSDICKAIGMSKGALYHHFENKRELFKTVIDSYLDKMRVKTEVTTLRDYLDLKIEYASKLYEHVNDIEVQPLNYVSLLIDAMRNYPDIKEAKNRVLSLELEEIKGLLKMAMTSGEIRSDINIESSAQNLLILSLGVATNLIRKDTNELSINLYKKQLNEYYFLLQPVK